MTAPDPRLGEIEARDTELGALCSPDCEGEDCQAERDRRYLLAALRKRDEALARVLEACDRIIDNADGHKPPGPPHPTREQATACRIRAAVTGGGE